MTTPATTSAQITLPSTPIARARRRTSAPRRAVAFARRLEPSLRDGTLALLRVIYGVLLLQTGYGKLTHHDGVAAYFASLHVPAPAATAWAIGGIALLCGALLVLGLGTRGAALALVGVLVGAMLTAHRAAFGDGLGAIASAEAFPFLVVALVLTAFGAGRASLDHLRAARRAHSTGR